MAALKEHGVLFLAPMVRAILAGTKTQTRRAVAGATGAFWDHGAYRPAMAPDGSGIAEWVPESGAVAKWGPTPKAPHGPVGRKLYVKETWQVATGLQAGDLGAAVRYRDTEVKACWMPADKPMPLGLTWDKWRPSIHMPRWASRITLEVTRVRVERVGDISEDDARAEGVNPRDAFIVFEGVDEDRVRRRPDMERTHRGAYACLWDEINGAGSFAASPWVWVYDFRRVG